MKNMKIIRNFCIFVLLVMPAWLSTDAGEPRLGDQFVGSWTYRSFRNIPEPFGDLENSQNLERYKDFLFAEAKLVITEINAGDLKGYLDMGDFGRLEIRGAISYGNPFTLRFQGTGKEGAPKGWIYDYIGYFVPSWPNGIDQRAAIVGSVIRTVPHGKAAAGYSASFIAVRQQ